MVFKLPLESGIGSVIQRSIQVEALSAPVGGGAALQLEKAEGGELLRMELTTDDLSTARAMLNSYLGLLSVAVRASAR